MNYTILKEEGLAKRARFETVHGSVETPVFMNVATAAAIKGGLSSADLMEIGTQIALCNTYHLHVRPGDETVFKLGGLHSFMRWERPILTDSGGFQVFSLADLRKIKEEGVTFHSHIDGARIFMGPEESMRIQSHLASTIAMAFDECPPSHAERDYVEQSVARTTRWLARCKEEMKRLNSLPETINKDQLLFGINQGAVYPDIRISHAEQISEMELDGYAVGGLAVGETHEEMYEILDAVVSHRLPQQERKARQSLYQLRDGADQERAVRAGRSSHRGGMRMPRVQGRLFPRLRKASCPLAGDTGTSDVRHA